ncbi:hypothetical protein Sste5346_002060 [Sporothrix stenoceras]|uniref:Uncharacterized protein n=1 Tax=Sporothrix stenoceras TaxID=5173 RepID=A0ABR3ZJW2_9PEZI
MASTSAHDALAGFTEPSEDEKQYYFHGLAGSPRLLARTSSTVWDRSAWGEWATPRKVITTLGPHALVKNWCPELRAALVAALNASDGAGGALPWEAFYPIRLGLDGHRKYDNPAVLLVSIRHHPSSSWSVAMRAALHCRDLLRVFGINDVEVEMKTAKIISFSSPAATSLSSKLDWTFAKRLEHRPYQTGADVNAALMPLLPFMGQRIEQEPAQHPGQAEAQAGSMGLLLRLEGQPGVYGLTSRHVAVSGRVDSNTSICEHPSECDSLHATSSSSLGGLRILSSSASDALDCASSLPRLTSNLVFFLRETEKAMAKHPDDAANVSLYETYRDALQYSKDARETVLAHADMLSEQDASIQHRLIGSVAYSPRHRINSFGNYDDWALIKLADADSEKIANKAYVAGSLARLTELQVGELQLYRKAVYNDLQFDDEGFVRIQGDNPRPLPPVDGDKRESVIVAKCGAKSGVTFGITNEIEAVRRTPSCSPSSGPFVSFHLLVLDFTGGHFSVPGDSGSAVFDTAGRVVGMVDAGQDLPGLVRHVKKYDSSDNTPHPDASAVPSQASIPEGFKELVRESSENVGGGDVTFVTPMPWVMESIKKLTNSVPKLY